MSEAPLFQSAKEKADQEVMVNLLTRLAEEPTVTQRTLAGEMGIAVGMMNNYIKSSISKGYLRAKQVSPRRWAYFVTPKGFAEKSRMVVSHLSSSLTFFRTIRLQLERLFELCAEKDISNIALVGEGDVADMAFLVKQEKMTLELKSLQDDLSSYEAILITDVMNPQGAYDLLKQRYLDSKILTLPALCIARKRVSSV